MGRIAASAQGHGAYVNALIEYVDDGLSATYGPAKLARLRSVKARYDPDNVFHRNVNITPA